MKQFRLSDTPLHSNELYHDRTFQKGMNPGKQSPISSLVDTPNTRSLRGVGKKKVTYYDLAKLAEVSSATVSRVIAGRQNVDATIRERVKRAAETLGFDIEKKRNDNGRTIAFVLGNRDVLHSFHARVLAGAESHALSHGWELFFLTLRYSPETTPQDVPLPEILGRRTQARGIILAGVNSMNLLDSLRRRNLPCSVLGNNLIGEHRQDLDVVYSDDVQGACDVTTYLISQGHRHIWFIGGTRLTWFTRCGKGYRQAMLTAGLEARICEIHSDGQELGYLGAKSILSRREPVTAIFAGSDHVAIGVYTALRELGLSVPADMSVVGFSDSEASILHPALTSVREFPEELGRHLAAFALNRIANPSLPPQQLTLGTQLIVRDSTQMLPANAPATPAGQAVSIQ